VSAIQHLSAIDILPYNSILKMAEFEQKYYGKFAGTIDKNSTQFTKK
jgi:hypothetical protein